jgi:hypothetical protein
VEKVGELGDRERFEGSLVTGELEDPTKGADNISEERQQRAREKTHLSTWLLSK